MFKISNIDIYEADNMIYLHFDDNKFFTITGEDTFDTSRIISKIINKQIYSEAQLSEELNIEIEKVKSIIQFLKNAMVLTTGSTLIEYTKIKNVLIVGNFSIDFDSNSYIANLCTDRIKYNLIKKIDYYEDFENYVDCDIILLFGPFLDKLDYILRFNEFYFLRNKTIVPINLGEQHYVIGPLIEKGLDTPCLESYIKRKLSNLTEPQTFLKLTRVNKLGKTTESYIDLNENFAIATQLLRIELDRFNTTTYSSILGRCITHNLYRGELYKSKVLPVHNLSYKPEGYTTPFN